MSIQVLSILVGVVTLNPVSVSAMSEIAVMFPFGKGAGECYACSFPLCRQNWLRQHGYGNTMIPGKTNEGSTMKENGETWKNPKIKGNKAKCPCRTYRLGEKLPMLSQKLEFDMSGKPIVGRNGIPKMIELHKDWIEIVTDNRVERMSRTLRREVSRNLSQQISDLKTETDKVIQSNSGLRYETDETRTIEMELEKFDNWGITTLDEALEKGHISAKEHKCLVTTLSLARDDVENWTLTPRRRRLANKTMSRLLRATDAGCA